MGTLGHGDFQDRTPLTPIDALAPYQIKDFAAGWAHTAVVSSCGRLLLFGRPHDVRKALSLRHMWQSLPFLVRIHQAMKRLFDSPRKGSAAFLREDVLLSPRAFPLPEGERPVRVACSGALTAIIVASGRVYCMGQNTFGQCGVGGTVLIPGVGGSGGREGERPTPQKMAAADVANVWTAMVPVQGLDEEELEESEVGESGEKGMRRVRDPVVDIALGFQHAVCCTASGRAFAWGKGERGQLGNGVAVNHNTACRVDLPEGTRVVKVASGFNHAAALAEGGMVWIWGKWQGLGRRSEGTGKGSELYEDQLLPREVELPGGVDGSVEDVGCGHFHTSVLLRGEGTGAGAWRLFMFGMRSHIRSMEPKPTPVSLPEVNLKGSGEVRWRFGTGGGMAHTLLECVDDEGVLGVYKAEFQGEWTQFVPVCSQWEAKGEGEEAGGGGADEDSEKGRKPRRQRRMLRYGEGLIHRLALMKEEDETK